MLEGILHWPLYYIIRLTGGYMNEHTVKQKWSEYKKIITTSSDYGGEVSCRGRLGEHLGIEINKKLNLDENYLIIGYEFCFGVPTDEDILIKVQFIKKDKNVTDLSNIYKKRKLNIKIKKINMKISTFLSFTEFTAKVFLPNILNIEKNIILGGEY